MDEKESVQDFLSRMTHIVSQMKSYGENVSSEKIVSKVLHSLNTKFDHIATVIEDSKDLSS